MSTRNYQQRTTTHPQPDTPIPDTPISTPAEPDCIVDVPSVRGRAVLSQNYHTESQQHAPPPAASIGRDGTVGKGTPSGTKPNVPPTSVNPDIATSSAGDTLLPQGSQSVDMSCPNVILSKATQVYAASSPPPSNGPTPPQDNDEVGVGRPSGDGCGTITLRKYHEILREWEDTVTESKRPPKEATAIQVFLKDSAQNYCPLSSKLDPPTQPPHPRRAQSGSAAELQQPSPEEPHHTNAPHSPEVNANVNVSRPPNSSPWSTVRPRVASAVRCSALGWAQRKIKAPTTSADLKENNTSNWGLSLMVTWVDNVSWSLPWLIRAGLQNHSGLETAWDLAS
ncbi:hypothetical protein B0H11DRAFT_1915833 [Mycena galericulata]|nr:hypothetical protein B0H11DRAFT_1915833 [Mycena galericulata]